MRWRLSRRLRRARVRRPAGPSEASRWPSRGHHHTEVDTVTHAVRSPPMRAKTTCVLTALALLALPSAAQARPAAAAQDGRPNILVVMTDDQAQADLAHMPNVKRLLAARGTTFADAVDSSRSAAPRGRPSSPASTPTTTACAQLLPVRLVRHEAPRQHAAGLAHAGYRTALIGKWLNGYARRARRGPGRLRHLARAARCVGLRLLQLRDEPERQAQDLGRRGLRAQARRVRQDRGDPQPGGLQGVLNACRTCFGPPIHLLWGAEDPRTTRRT